MLINHLGKTQQDIKYKMLPIKDKSMQFAYQISSVKSSKNLKKKKLNFPLNFEQTVSDGRGKSAKQQILNSKTGQYEIWSRI